MTWWQNVIAIAVSSGATARAWEWYRKREWRRALARLGISATEFEHELARLRATKALPK